MKKQILSLLLLCLVCTLNAQKKTYNIGFLFDEVNVEAKPLLEQLKKEIKAVVGEDATIVFNSKNQLVSGYDIQKAKANYNALQQTSDLIISFGAFDNLVIRQEKTYPVPVITIGGLSSEVSGLDQQKKTSGIHNLTYIVSNDSFSDDIKTFQKLTKFNTVGVVVEKPITELIDFNALFNKSLKGDDINIKLIPYTTLEDIYTNLDGIDALQLAGGFSLKTSEVKELAQKLIEKKIPSFSSVRKSDVANGILATNQGEDNFNTFFRRIALSIESYVNGTNFSELPVLLDFNNELTLNFNTAQALSVPLRYSLIGQTEFIGDVNNNPSAQKVYDLPMVINDVLKNNLSLQATEKDVLVNEQNVKTAKSNYLPSVTATATGTYIDPDIAAISNGQNPEFGTSGNVTLQQVLFSESANANIGIQKSLAKAQREKFNTEQLDAVFNGANAYFNTLILKANLDIQMRNLDLTKKNLEIAEENYNAGQSGKTDVLRLQSQQAQNTQAMIEGINRLNQSFIGINQLTNNATDFDIDVKEATLNQELFQQYNYDKFIDILDSPVQREPFVEFLIEEALNNAPELKQLNYNLDAVKRQTKLYGTGRFLPTLSLQGQYNYQFSRSGVGSTFPAGFPAAPNGNYNVGVNLSLPIFNKNTNTINKQTAIIQQEQLQINSDNVKLAISANVRNGVLNLINQISNIELSKVSEASAKEALELTQTSYSTGAVNIVQLLDAQNNYLNAQLAKANAIYNYLITTLQLERYLGYYFLLHTEEDNTKFNQRFLEFLNKN
ncbi:TolC family protein [uncultured Tenacibaculum sp.]|uniref:TolC family protein n=1 Tax=uncultured Tenacibaculum sp. TaxID=174713 RepID=UPI002605F3CF|nr:TolC family protein [uncultured Tenacibaculum sp.]